jgi:alkanesulfonate monooxygenase SsuD/methylene tetrahydromethanopterin reductase-like flavin-dependent oxidoreductase (luciferase family)
VIQVPGLGEVGDPVLEAYTTLGALASVTSTINLGALVTGMGYRQPALLAKMVTTLDLVSGGRALLGLGAGWYEREHVSYGYPYPPTRVRLERLAEGLEVITGLLKDGHVTFAGTHYQVEDARNDPRVRPNLPVIVGGTGERLTFGAAARFADHLNIECGISELPRKLAAVDARCAEIGRERSTLAVSFFAYVTVADTSDQARRQLREQLRRQGIDYDQLSGRQRAELTDRHLTGTPQEIAERLNKEVLGPGVDGLIVGIQDADRYPASIDLTADAVLPLLNR